MAIGDRLQEMQRNTLLPRISGEQCVHAMIEMGECSACVDACPAGAWILDDEQLGFEESACDGCGLCVAACPRRAIVNDMEVLSVWFRDHRVALLSCEKSGLDGDGVVPCVHAVSLDHLLGLYREGVRTLLYTHADCASCERGGGDCDLGTLTGHLRALLQSRGQPLMKSRFFPVAEWRERRRVLMRSGLAGAGADRSRRGFLRDIAGGVVRQGMHAVKVPLPPDEERRVSIDHWLGQGEQEPIYPAVPVLDANRCTACGACVNICPEDALSLNRELPAYQVDPGACTACRLCEPVCAEKAIRIEEWSPGKPVSLPLREKRCQSCGVPYFRLAEAGPENGEQCPVCQRVNHNRNLYQVLDQ